MESVKEQSCWREFISGSDVAFRTLYDAFADRLFCFGYNYCQDKEMVKDAIQDLFIDLHRYRSNLDLEVNLTAYLFSSLRRKLFRAVKLARRQEWLENRDAETEFLMDPDTETSMIRNEQRDELASFLAQEIARLPGRQREALYLRYTLELSYKDMAVIMEISIATSRTLVYRGLRQLRRNMRDFRIPAMNTPLSANPPLPTMG